MHTFFALEVNLDLMRGAQKIRDYILERKLKYPWKTPRV